MSDKILLLKRNIFSKIALIAFLLTFPFSIRKVFFVFSPDGSGSFNEYTNISLYLSDLTALVLLTIIILENKNSILSISWWKKMFHVEQLLLPLITPLPFLCWSAVSIFWSKNEILAFYATLRLFEGYFVYLAFIFFLVPRETMKQLCEKCSTWNNFDLKKYTARMFHVEQFKENSESVEIWSKNVPRGTIGNMIHSFEKCSTWNNWNIIFISIVLFGLFQSIIAIFQFIQQSSLGLFFLKESIFSPSQVGIAKIVFENDIFIRSYGLFPHPNILGGFLGVSIIFTITYPLIIDKKLFHVEQSIFLYQLALFIQMFGFLLSFSKSAYLGLFLAILYYFMRLFHVEHSFIIRSNTQNVPRGTFLYLKKWLQQKCSTWNILCFQKNKEKMFHVEHWQYFTLAIAFVFVIIFFITRINWYYFIIQPSVERYFFFKEFFAIAHQHFFTGIGIGQSVLVMQDFFLEKLNMWQFQPIHSLYLLIFSEVGFSGLVFFLLFLLSMFIVPRGTMSAWIYYFFIKCSTWNIFRHKNFLKNKMFHVEQLYERSNRIPISDKNVPRGTIGEEALSILSTTLLIFMFIISIFDHYLFDIQQGKLLFWLVLAVSYISAQKVNN